MIAELEIVLANGQFAAIRRPTFLDMAYAHHPNEMIFMAQLAARIVTLDDEPITYDQFACLDAELAMPIANHIGTMLSHKNPKGVA